MSSRSEKTLRQIRQILQTSDDYERNERNLSQNSPFSCYLTPRANLYNQYPYRIPLSRKSPKSSTKKRRTKKNIEDLVDSPFLFNNSNSIYHQLSNSAKKAFLPYPNSRLNSSSNLYSNSIINTKKQSQSVQTSLALILDQSDSPDHDPITAKQNEILYFINICDNIRLKRFFNRWRQRWFYQTAYNAQKLMQTTGIASISRHSRRNLTHDSSIRDNQEPNEYENKKGLSSNRKSGHHYSISGGNKNAISSGINKRLTQTELVNKNGYPTPNSPNYNPGFSEDYEFIEYEENDQTAKNNRHSPKHRQTRKLTAQESSMNSLSNKRDEYNDFDENEYEYADDDENGGDLLDSISENNGKGRKRPKKLFVQTGQNHGQKKLSKTAAFQKEKMINDQSKRHYSADQNNRKFVLNSKEKDQDEDDDFSDFSNLLNNQKSLLNDKTNNSRRNSPNKNRPNSSTKIDLNLFDSSSLSLIDTKNSPKTQKNKNLNSSMVKSGEKDDRHRSRSNSPTRNKTNDKQRINQNFFDDSENSLLDDRIQYKQQKTQTSSRIQINSEKDDHHSRKNSPNKGHSKEIQQFSDYSINSELENQKIKNSTRKESRLYDDLANQGSSRRNSPTNRSKQLDNNRINQNEYDYDNNLQITKGSSHRNSPTNRNKQMDYNRTNQNESDYDNNIQITKGSSHRNSPTNRSKQMDYNRSNQNESDYDNNIQITKGSSHRNSPTNRSKQNDYNRTNQNEYDFDNSIQRTKGSSHRNSPTNRNHQMDYNRSNQNESDYDNNIQITKSSSHRNSSRVETNENKQQSSRLNSPTRTKSGINEKMSQNESDYSVESFFNNKTQQSKLQNTKNKSTQKNLSSDENTQSHSRSKRMNQNFDDYSNEETTKNQSKQHRSKRNSPINNDKNHRKSQQNNNNSVEYANYSDYSNQNYSNYTNSEQEQNQNQKYRSRNQRTKEFTFADSKTFSPIKSPKNFDDIVSQIIPDLDEFIEKYSTKHQNLSIDDESDGEFKSLIEKTKFYESKYSHITLDNLDDENNNHRRSAAFNNLIPVNTSLSSQNASNFNNNNNFNSTLPELHEFDHEMSEENRSPPLYFNK